MKREFDIAISYKSEIEEKAIKIRNYLVEDGWSVFLACMEQQEFLSENIYQMLYGIYKNRSLMKVLLISEAYLDGEWTSLEKRASLESTKEDRKRLLIVNYTNQIILPEDLQSLQYLDGCRYHEDEVAFIITERMKKFVVNKKENERGKVGQDTTVNITVNKGVITGDHAKFNDIHF